MTEKNSKREKALLEKVRSKTASQEQCARLYRLLTHRGAEVPIDFREYWLTMALEEDPENIDNCLALRGVLREQGKPIPEDLEAKCLQRFTEEEWNEDHQASAARIEEQADHTDMSPEFLSLFEACRNYSMTSIERFFGLFSAVEYLHKSEIEGCLVECGVWRGGSMMLAAKTLLSLGDGERELYLFDTFEGLPRPDEERDVDLFGNRAIDGWLPRSVSDGASHWAEAGLEEVQRNMASTGYDQDRIHYIKGMVEDTLPDQAPSGDIALLRLDTDFFTSTKAEMEHLFPKLVKGGVLLIDDYGHFQGARDAIDEYLDEFSVKMLLSRLDYTGRMGVKI